MSKGAEVMFGEWYAFVVIHCSGELCNLMKYDIA
jgi:hypothetical protein